MGIYSEASDWGGLLWSGSRQLQGAAVSLSGQCVPYRLTAALILVQTAAAPPSCTTPPPTSLLPVARCSSEASLDSWMCTTCHCLPSPWPSAKHRGGAEKKKGGPKKKTSAEASSQPPTLAALFLFFFYAGEYLLMRQRQGATVSRGWARGRRRGCWDVGGEANMADMLKVTQIESLNV